MASPTTSSLTSSIEKLTSTLANSLPALSPSELPSHLPSIIDHTLLAPTATPQQITTVCQEAIQLKAATVCVNSSMVKTAAKVLEGSGVLPISVVGFPFGAMDSESKAMEAKKAVEDGAREIDMVINLGFLLSSDLSAVYQDVSLVVQASKPYPVKVILESSLLSRSHLIAASYISCLAGAKFLKTSTGYGLPPAEGWGKSPSNDMKPSGGAQTEDVRLMFEIARAQDYGYGYQVEVKASGGIRSLETVRTMWKSGATRVGASGTTKIVEEAETEKLGGKVGKDEGGNGY